MWDYNDLYGVMRCAAFLSQFFGGCMDFLKPDVREQLMQEHFEFRHLLEEHKAADERLIHLMNKSALTTRESMEEVELKKTKLRAKERIYKIVQEFNKSRGQ
jgi:uncharacterized protein YdcH (DUF465 family)